MSRHKTVPCVDWRLRDINEEMCGRLRLHLIGHASLMTGDGQCWRTVLEGAVGSLPSGNRQQAIWSTNVDDNRLPVRQWEARDCNG